MMYRHCIYCSADLRSNEAIEHFPVGRQIAFDAEKGRLWAVCARCARWNLAPIEERWEAVEEAEKRFVDTRVRVQRENIGLAKLADGTRLIRIGAALPGELAAWRYGETLRGRYRRHLLWVAAGVAATAAVGGLHLMGIVGGAVGTLWGFSDHIHEAVKERRTVYRLAPSQPGEETKAVRRRDLRAARLGEDRDGQLLLEIPNAPGHTGDAPLVIRGSHVRRVMERTLVWVNESGARRRTVDLAVAQLAGVGDADAYLRKAARHSYPLVSGVVTRTSDGKRRHETVGSVSKPELLALEMALHEEQERRALDGELALLESAWKDAERIAAIADRLADTGTDVHMRERA